MNDVVITKLDLDRARENLCHDEVLLCEIAKVFVDDVPQLCRDLTRASGRNDQRAICLLAHSLKSLCATFGAEPARTLAEKLEQGVLEVGSSKVMPEQIHHLVSVLEETICHLKRDVLVKSD